MVHLGSTFFHIYQLASENMQTWALKMTPTQSRQLGDVTQPRLAEFDGQKAFYSDVTFSRQVICGLSFFHDIFRKQHFVAIWLFLKPLSFPLVPIIPHIVPYYSVLFNYSHISHMISTVFCDREYLYQKYAGAKYDQLKAQLDPEGVLPRPRDPRMAERDSGWQSILH